MASELSTLMTSLGITTPSMTLYNGAAVVDQTLGPAYDITATDCDGTNDYGDATVSASSSNRVLVLAGTLRATNTEAIQNIMLDASNRLTVITNASGFIKFILKQGGSTLEDVATTFQVTANEPFALAIMASDTGADCLFVANGTDYSSEIVSSDTTMSTYTDYRIGRNHSATYGNLIIHAHGYKDGSITAAEAIDLTNKMLQQSQAGGYVYSKLSANQTSGSAGDPIGFNVHQIKGFSVNTDDEMVLRGGENYLSLSNVRMNRPNSSYRYYHYDRTGSSQAGMDDLVVATNNANQTTSSALMGSIISPMSDMDLSTYQIVQPNIIYSDGTSHLSIELMTNQSAAAVGGTSGLSGGDYVLFNEYKEVIGDNFTYDESTGVLSVTGGTTAIIYADPQFTGVTGSTDYDLYNITDTSTVATGLAVSPNSSSNLCSSGGILVVVSPTVDTDYAVRRTSGSASTNDNGSSLWALEIAGDYDYSTWNQSTNLGTGDDIEFTHVSGNMTYDDVANTRTADSGKHYIMVSRNQAVGSSSSTYSRLTWHNSTDAVDIGDYSNSLMVSSAGNTNSAPTAMASISPSVNTDLKMQTVLGGSLTSINGSMIIMEIGEGAIPTADPVQYGNNYMMIAAGHYREWLEKQEKEKKKNNNQGV